MIAYMTTTNKRLNHALDDVETSISKRADIILIQLDVDAQSDKENFDENECIWAVK